MSIISPADFVGPVKIANNDDTYNGVAQNVQAFIDDYEPQFLKKLLGSNLYADLLAGLAADPVLPKWTTLVSYIKPADKRFVYFQYLESKITDTVGVGEVKAQTDNAIPASTWDKQVKAWNEMVDYNKELHDFIIKNSADYPGFIYWSIDYTPFYVNGWFDYSFYFRNRCELVPEIYRYKNTLDI